jgi:hypothetical protein
MIPAISADPCRAVTVKAPTAARNATISTIANFFPILFPPRIPSRVCNDYFRHQDKSVAGFDKKNFARQLSASGR